MERGWVDKELLPREAGMALAPSFEGLGVIDAGVGDGGLAD